MEGCQHNTMDVEYYGPNPQMGFLYLGALRAVEQMARHLGETHFAEACHQLFKNGSRWLDENLFDGEYYRHRVVTSENGLVAEGLGNREIAEMLALSEHTVKNYLFHIFDKLGISNRVELVFYAVSNPKGAPSAPPPQDKPLAKAAGRGV